jgi:hypothetical protein
MLGNMRALVPVDYLEFALETFDGNVYRNFH